MQFPSSQKFPIPKIFVSVLAFSFLPLLLFQCDSGEKTRMQSKIDSLQMELEINHQMAQTLEEVGTLLDSIDENRQLLRTQIVEGTLYEDYTSRLENINEHIKNTEAKISTLESALKKSKSNNSDYLITIKRLKVQLKESQEQVLALQAEIETIKEENEKLATLVVKKDSVITKRETRIKMQEKDINTLEDEVMEAMIKSKQSEADLYFQQAEALVEAAGRTKFAPKKKKNTLKEALELYKLSAYLGKTEAKEKIEKLEKELG